MDRLDKLIIMKRLQKEAESMGFVVIRKEFNEANYKEILELRQFNKTLEKEVRDLRSKLTDHGVAAELLRVPANFQKIDDVLEKYQRPFNLSEIFGDWVKLTQMTQERKKTLSTLRTHFAELLKNNGVIHKTGGAGRGTLWRVNETYSYFLRKAKELNWRKTGQDEGTYLVPSL
jgi:hypothetical protein